MNELICFTLFVDLGAGEVIIQFVQTWHFILKAGILLKDFCQIGRIFPNHIQGMPQNILIIVEYILCDLNIMKDKDLVMIAQYKIIQNNKVR